MKLNKLKVLVLGFASLLITLESCRKEKDDELILRNKQEQNSTGDQSPCESVMYTDAAMKTRMQEMERSVQANITRGGHRSTNSVVTIPVVFHIVYNLQEQNISDAQIQSQIAVLNQDFAGTNADITGVPAAFQPVIGHSQIQFALALRDPNGNATNGIIRTPTSVASFGSDGAVCYASAGGSDAWPASQYLNIWVCNKTGGAGYSTYPWSGSTSTDGVIVGYNYVGNTGTFTNNWNYQKGRTVTHEVGHWLGLIHIWGDMTCGDDLVGDSPAQAAASGSCPTFPHLSACSPDGNGDMFMNYMDYSYDACRKMFTIGQVTRMQSYLSTTRASLATSLGAVAPGGGSLACNVPSSLAATSVSQSGATLGWASTGAVNYSVRYKATTSTTWITTSTSSTSTAISGLAASTPYEFQVQSNCSGSTSAYSSSATFTTSSAVVITCNTPFGLAASSVTSSSAYFGWASTGAIGYSIRYKPTTSSTWATVSTSSTAIAVSGLGASTSYEFQVQSNCSGGSSSYSSSAVFTTASTQSVCNIPSGLTATSVTATGATLSWYPTGAISYNVRYKPTTLAAWTTVSTASPIWNLYGLASFTTYEFQVQSVCSGGVSSFSTSFTFITPRQNGKGAKRK